MHAFITDRRFVQDSTRRQAEEREIRDAFSILDNTNHVDAPSPLIKKLLDNESQHENIKRMAAKLGVFIDGSGGGAAAAAADAVPTDPTQVLAKDIYKKDYSTIYPSAGIILHNIYLRDLLVCNVRYQAEGGAGGEVGGAQAGGANKPIPQAPVSDSPIPEPEEEIESVGDSLIKKHEEVEKILYKYLYESIIILLADTDDNGNIKGLNEGLYQYNGTKKSSVDPTEDNFGMMAIFAGYNTLSDYLKTIKSPSNNKFSNNDDKISYNDSEYEYEYKQELLLDKLNPEEDVKTAEEKVIYGKLMHTPNYFKKCLDEYRKLIKPDESGGHTGRGTVVRAHMTAEAAAGAPTALAVPDTGSQAASPDPEIIQGLNDRFIRFIQDGNSDIINDDVIRIFNDMIAESNVQGAQGLLDAITAEAAAAGAGADDLQSIIIQNPSPPGSPVE